MHQSTAKLIKEKKAEIRKLEAEIAMLEAMPPNSICLSLHMDAFSNELGKRITNHIRHMTVAELVTKTEEDLSNIPLIGNLAIKKIEEWLKKYGLKLSSK